jgi:hypothetical protein
MVVFMVAVWVAVALIRSWPRMPPAPSGIANMLIAKTVAPKLPPLSNPWERWPPDLSHVI